jgi:energy-converting hydrogenase A subunit M
MTDKYTLAAIETLLDACNGTSYASNQWVAILRQLLDDRETMCEALTHARDMFHCYSMHSHVEEIDKALGEVTK